MGGSIGGALPIGDPIRKPVDLTPSPVVQNQINQQANWNAQPKSVQNTLNNWIKTNPNLVNDANALHTLSTQTGMDQNNLHDLAVYAAAHKPINIMHAVGNFAGHAASQVLGSFWDYTGGYIGRSAKGAFGYLTGNQKLQQEYDPEQAVKMGVGSITNTVTAPFHMPGYVMSDWRVHGVGAGIGDIAGQLANIALMHKYAGSLKEAKPGAVGDMGSFAERTKQFIDNIREKISRGETPSPEEMAKLNDALKYDRYFKEAEAAVEKQKYRVKFGEAVGATLGVARSGLRAVGSVAKDPAVTFSMASGSLGQRAFDTNLWNQTSNGDVVDEFGNRQTQTEYIRGILGQQDNWLFSEGQFKAGPISFKGGLLEAYQYLFADDPFAALGRLRKVAKSQYGFAGKLKRLYQGTGIRQSGDARIAYGQLGSVKRTVDRIAEMSSPGKIAAAFPNQMSRKLIKALSEASTPDAVLSIFDDIAFAGELFTYRMPMLGSFQLWKTALDGELGAKLGIVGNVFDRQYTADVYAQLKKDFKVDVAPDPLLDPSMALGDKVAVAWRKTLAMQFKSRAFFYNSAIKAMSGKEIKANDLGSLGYIKSWMESAGNFEPAAVEASLDYLFHTVDNLKWNNFMYNIVEQGVMRPINGIVKTADVQRMYDMINLNFKQSLWNLLGADLGSIQGVYGIDAMGLGVKTLAKLTKQTALHIGQLGKISFPDARTIKDVSRTTAKFFAQLNASPIDEMYRTSLFEQTAHNEVVAEIAKVKVKDVVRTITEHWSAVEQKISTIYDDPAMQKAYQNNLEHLLNKMHGFINTPANHALNEAQRYALTMDIISKETAKSGKLKLEVDQALKEKREFIADVNTRKFSNDFQDHYLEGEALSTSDLEHLQNLLTAELSASRHVLNKFADQISEQFSSAANLKEMANYTNRLAGISGKALETANRQFVDHWETARIGRVYFFRELRKLTPLLIGAARASQTSQAGQNALIYAKAAAQRFKERYIRENPYGDFTDKEFVSKIDEFLSNIEDPIKLRKHEDLIARLHKLGAIGENMPDDFLVDIKKLENFVEIAEKHPEAAIEMIKKTRSQPGRLGLSFQRNFRNNREIVTDAINNSVNTTFKALALLSVSWATHVSMSEFMLNSMRLGGNNFFNARFAFAASRWEYRLAKKMINGERQLLANTLGGIWYGMKRGLIDGMTEAEKDILMEDSFWLLMNNDGHFPLGVHGHAGNVDTEGATEMGFQKVFGVEDGGPSAKRVFVGPDWTHINPTDDGYASAWMDYVKLQGTDQLGSKVAQIVYKKVMSEGANIIAKDEKTFGDKIMEIASKLAREGDHGWQFDAAEKEMEHILNELAARDDFKQLTAFERDQLVKNLESGLLRSPEQISAEMMTEAGRARYLEATDYIRQNEHALDVRSQQADIDYYNLKKILPEVAPFTIKGQRKGEFAKLAMKMFGRNVETRDILEALASDTRNPMMQAARRVMKFEKVNKELEEASASLERARILREDHPYRAYSDIIKKENRLDFIQNIKSSIGQQLDRVRVSSNGILRNMARSAQRKVYAEDREMIDKCDPAIFQAHDNLYKDSNIYGKGDRVGAWNTLLEDQFADVQISRYYDEKGPKDWRKWNKYDYYEPTEEMVNELKDRIIKRISSQYTFSHESIVADKTLKQLSETIFWSTNETFESFFKKFVKEAQGASTIPVIEKWAIDSKRIKKGSWDKMSVDERRKLVGEYGEIMQTHDSLRQVSETALGHFGNDTQTPLAQFQKVFETLAQHNAGGKRMADAMDLANTVPSSRRWNTLLKWRDVNLDVVLNADGLSEEQWMSKLQNHFENRYVNYKSTLFNSKAGDKFKTYSADEKGLRRFMGDLARYGNKETPWRERFIKNSGVEVFAPSQYEKWFKAEIIKEAKMAERRRLEQSFADVDEAYHQAREAAAKVRSRFNDVSKDLQESPDVTGLINPEALARYREAFLKYSQSAKSRDAIGNEMRRMREARDRIQRETFDRYNAQVESQIDEANKEFERLIQRAPSQVLAEAKARGERLGSADERIIGEWSNAFKYNFDHLPELPKLDIESLLRSRVYPDQGDFNGGFIRFDFPGEGMQGAIKFPQVDPEEAAAFLVNWKELIKEAAANGEEVTLKDFLKVPYFEDGWFGNLPTEYNPKQVAELSQLHTSVAKALDAPVGENIPFPFSSEVEKRTNLNTGVAMPWYGEMETLREILDIDQSQLTTQQRTLYEILRNLRAETGGNYTTGLLTANTWDNLPIDTMQQVARLQITDLLTLNFDRHNYNVLVDTEDLRFRGIDHELTFRNHGVLDDAQADVMFETNAAKISKYLGGWDPRTTETPVTLFTADDIIQMDNEIKDLYKYGKMSEGFQRPILELVTTDIWDKAIQGLLNQGHLRLMVGEEWKALIQSIKDGEFPRPVEQYTPLRSIPTLREAIMTDLAEKDFFDKVGRHDYSRSNIQKHRSAGMQALLSMYGDKAALQDEKLASAQEEAIQQLGLTVGAKKFSGEAGRKELHDHVWSEVYNYLRSMKKSDRDRFERSVYPLENEKLASPDGDPIKDFATALTISGLNTHYSSVNDILHPEILHQTGTGNFKSPQWMSQFVADKIRHDGNGAVPKNVPARQTSRFLSKATFTNLIPMVSQAGHAKVLGPIVNDMVRSPLFLAEYHNQMNQIRPMIEQGFIQEEVARQRAETLAAINMDQFVHEPLGKTMWEQNMRVLAPFYFAKNQAVRRAARLAKDDIAALDHYLRLNLFFTSFIADAVDGNGNSTIVIPGSQMYGSIVTGVLEMTGALTGLGMMPGQSMQMGFSGSPGSVNSMLITGTEAGFGNMMAGMGRIPFGPVVVLPAKFYYEYVSHHSQTVFHVMEAILGKEALQTSFMSDLMPNKDARNAWTLARGIAHIPTGSYMSMQNNIASTTFSQVWLDQYQMVVQEHPDASSSDQRYMTNVRCDIWMKEHKNEFRSNVNWSTAIAFAFKSLISEVSPLSTQFNNTFSESKIYNEMASQKNPDGTLTYPDLTSLMVAFLTKYPGHAFDIVGRTASPTGVWQPVKLSKELIDKHQGLVMEVPTGAAYTIPRSRDSKYDAPTQGILISVGLRKGKDLDTFIKAMMITMGDDNYYNILEPEYRTKYPDGRGGISVAGRKILDNEVNAIQTINSDWYDSKYSSTRGNLADRAYQDMKKMVEPGSKYNVLFQSAAQRHQFEFFVNARIEWEQMYKSAPPQLQSYWKNQWYDKTSQWYDDPKYADYQPFLSLMRKLPIPL
jgi:hypothetical protein